MSPNLIVALPSFGRKATEIKDVSFSMFTNSFQKGDLNKILLETSSVIMCHFCSVFSLQAEDSSTNSQISGYCQILHERSHDTYIDPKYLDPSYLAKLQVFLSCRLHFRERSPTQNRMSVSAHRPQNWGRWALTDLKLKVGERSRYNVISEVGERSPTSFLRSVSAHRPQNLCRWALTDIYSQGTMSAHRPSI